MKLVLARWVRFGGRFLIRVAPVVCLTACPSCRTAPARDDGLVGMVYHAMKHSDDPSAGVVTNLAPPPARRDPAPVPSPERPAAEDSRPVDRAAPAANLAPVEPPAYRISPGDVLAVSYFAHPGEGIQEYLVDRQDVLAISVAGQETYTADVRVRPDGAISFYIAGEIKAAGLTVAQIRSELAARIAKVMPGAEVTVMLKTANALARDFLDTLRSNTDLGSTRIIQVRHDGAVTFPLVGEVRAMGKTLAELSKEVESAYERVFRGGIAVALNLNSSSDGNIAVLGEVRSPGRYTITTPVSPFFALAMAGGALDTARKSQVVVVKRRADGRVGWHVVNLDVDSHRPLGPEIALAPQDMLLVPKTGIANLNLFVEQYVRRLLPLPTGMGFSYDLTPE